MAVVISGVLPYHHDNDDHNGIVNDNDYEMVIMEK